MLAPVLATVAVVSVLVTTAVAGQQYASEQRQAAGPTTSASPTTSAPATPTDRASTFPAGQVVYSDADLNAYFEIPSAADGWTKANGKIIGFESVNEGPKPLVKDPAYFRHGWCRADEEWSNRAYVGFGSKVTTEDLTAVNEEVFKNWVDAIVTDEDPDTPAKGRVTEPQDVEQGELTFADGGSGRISSARIKVVSDGQKEADDVCNPPAMGLVVVSRDTGLKIANVVALYDIGTQRDVERDVIDTIVRSLRPIE